MIREDRVNNIKDVEEYIHRVIALIYELQSVRQKLIEVNNSLNNICMPNKGHYLQAFYADEIGKIEKIIHQNEMLLQMLERMRKRWRDFL